MSPSLALKSPVFLFYLALAASLLIIAGATLALLTWGLRKNVSHARQAYCGWLFMAPVLLLVFFLGREAAILFVAIVAILGFREFARATSLSDDSMITWAVCVGISLTGVACLLTDPTTGKPGWYGLFMALPVFVVAMLLAIPVLRDRTQGQLRVLSLGIVAYVYFGWMLGHLALLACSNFAYSYLGYLVVAVELSDIAAYVSGKWFGRHPLRRNISSKKTWEGAVGALAISMLLPWALRFSFPHFEAVDCLVVGLIVGVGSQIGDLVVSVMKRDLEVKDMGALIPGHGGILDRIDSLIYVAPLFFHYVRCRHDLNPTALYSRFAYAF